MLSHQLTVQQAKFFTGDTVYILKSSRILSKIKPLQKSNLHKIGCLGFKFLGEIYRVGSTFLGAVGRHSQRGKQVNMNQISPFEL